MGRSCPSRAFGKAEQRVLLTDGSPFGVSVITRAFEDQAGIEIAARPTGQEPTPLPATGVDLAVFGAHLRGQPLNHQLTVTGARCAGEVTTTAAYRLFALTTTPAKPGLIRGSLSTGAHITGERWTLSPTALGHFVAALPAPMSRGPIELADGTWVLGFQCDPHSPSTDTDITEHGGWRAYMEATAV
ncbi:hypothetical protein [Streptomyces sp. NPDC051554]|uniref:allophanate hydrolase-related protein n=1 Tax=Streptomyces sp. NPDC051554 TaxID=3365656 RepID=UPI0037A5CECF